MMKGISKVAREFFFLAAALGMAAFAQAAEDTYPPAGATRGEVVVANTSILCALVEAPYTLL